MTAADSRRRLEAAFTLFKTLEPKAAAGLSAADLDDLRETLAAFAGDAKVEIAKLADLTRHLTPSISPRTFHDLMVPLERALEKNVRDDDFLVSTEDRARAQPPLPLRLVLDDLRSAFNVGSILRSADGLGVERVHLCGYTPAPDEAKAQRAALGAENAVAWEKNDDALAALKKLKAEGYHLVALETAGKSKPLGEVYPRVKTALIFGNERFGLGADRLALCDDVRRLDLQGTKNSLNVAVIAALATYEWRRQWTTPSN